MGQRAGAVGSRQREGHHLEDRDRRRRCRHTRPAAGGHRGTTGPDRAVLRLPRRRNVPCRVAAGRVRSGHPRHLHGRTDRHGRGRKTARNGPRRAHRVLHHQQRIRQRKLCGQRLLLSAQAERKGRDPDHARPGGSRRTGAPAHRAPAGRQQHHPAGHRVRGLRGALRHAARPARRYPHRAGGFCPDRSAAVRLSVFPQPLQGADRRSLRGRVAKRGLLHHERRHHRPDQPPQGQGVTDAYSSFLFSRLRSGGDA